MGKAEMIDKGKSKMTKKAATMKGNYDAKKEDMIAEFKAVGFKAIRNKNYEDMVRAAEHRTDSAKWAKNWEKAMFD